MRHRLKRRSLEHKHKSHDPGRVDMNTKTFRWNKFRNNISARLEMSYVNKLPSASPTLRAHHDASLPPHPSPLSTPKHTPLSPPPLREAGRAPAQRGRRRRARCSHQTHSRPQPRNVSCRLFFVLCACLPATTSGCCNEGKHAKKSYFYLRGKNPSALRQQQASLQRRGSGPSGNTPIRQSPPRQHGLPSHQTHKPHRFPLIHTLRKGAPPHRRTHILNVVPVTPMSVSHLYLSVAPFEIDPHRVGVPRPPLKSNFHRFSSSEPFPLRRRRLTQVLAPPCIPLLDS